MKEQAFEMFDSSSNRKKYIMALKITFYWRSQSWMSLLFAFWMGAFNVISFWEHGIGKVDGVFDSVLDPSC